MSEGQAVTRPITGSLGANAFAQQLGFFLLSAMIIYVTIFDSMSIAAVPLWLLLPFIGAAAILYYPALAQDFAYLFHKVEWRVVAPWIFYVGVVAIFLVVGGKFEEGFGRRVVLTAMQLAGLMVAMTLAYSTSPRKILYLLVAIAVVHGVVALGQVLQVGWARNLPNIIISFGGNASDDSQAVNPYDAIKDSVRARGLLFFVHKFNPMQGMLAVILIAFYSAGGRIAAFKYQYSRIVIAIGALFGTIGMALTFSRSTLLGLGATVMAIWWLGSKSNRFTRMMVVLGAVVVFAAGLAVTSLPLVARLLSSDPFDAENLSRTKQLIYTWQVLWESPIFGAPMKILPGEYPVHSVLFRTFTDFGLVGAVPYLCVIIGTLTLVWRYARSPDRAIRTAALAVFGVMMIILSDGWTHSSGLMQTDVAQAVLLGTMLGVMFGAERDALLVRRRLQSDESYTQKAAIGSSTA